MSQSLFNKKILAKHIKPTSIPLKHLEVITSWVSQIKSGTFRNLNEIQVHSAFAQQIMSKLLGYKTVGEANPYSVAVEYPVAAGRVDLALGGFTGNKDYSGDSILAPLELKGASMRNLDAIMPGRHKTPVQQAFEYARDIRGAKWVLVSNYLEIRLYAVSETSLVYERFFFEELTNPTEYARIQLLLGADNFLTGVAERLLQESEEADKDISDQLYEDYKLLRENSLSHLIIDNPHVPPKALIAPAQKLLDRILFIAFAEDKGLVPDSSIQRAFEHQDPYNPKPIYRNFVGLFNSVDKGNPALNIPAYNGGLFGEDEFLDGLAVSDELCEGFKELAQYDFDSEVSVTVLGHIFEQSISDLEGLIESISTGDIPKPKRKSSSVSGKRKKHGVVYTPDNITRFIVENTLGAYISERFMALFSSYGKYLPDGSVQWKRGVKTEERFWHSWQGELNTIKVVDPAVGSGAFMVAAFDFLLVEYEKVNEKLSEITGQRSVLDLNKEILNNNLYGVDINEESIEITKLSLWLKTAERGKPLESLDANFISGNSLGFNVPVPGEQFYWRKEFSEVFEEGGFDVVLGNPPYVRMEYLKELRQWLVANYEITSDRMDLYGYFFELGYRILKQGGKLSYISSATFFKTGSSRGLREFLLNGFNIEQIVNFNDLQVFKGVTTYPAILIVNKSAPESSNVIRFLDLTESIPEDLNASFAQEAGEMLQSQLSASGWQLQDLKSYRLLEKLKGDYKTLAEVYGAPQYGIKTGYNEAFVISNEVAQHLILQDPKSAELLKPFLEGKDLKKWHNQSRNLYIIYIPKGVVDIDNYPAIKAWLEPFKDRLERRATKQEWFELQQAQLAYKPSFEGVKIQYAHFNAEPLFHLNSDGAFSNDKSYIIPSSDYYLYGLLNSSALWFVMRSLCPFVRGGYYELRVQYIETLPIPPKPKRSKIGSNAKRCQEAAEQRFKLEGTLRRRLADLTPEKGVFKLNNKLESWWGLSFSEFQVEIRKAFKGVIPLGERDEWQDYFESMKQKRQQVHSKLLALEAELDEEVYSLFKLTSEEVEILKGPV